MPDSKKPIFLVIDDEIGICSFFEELGEVNNWKVDTALNYEEAVAKFRANYYSIVFIDIIIPGKNGMEILNEFKKIKSNCLFVMITGKASNEEIHKSYTTAGAYTCIKKPFSIEKLVNLINMMLKIDPEKFKLTAVKKPNKLKRILTYIMVSVLTFFAALMFISYSAYRNGYFKSQKGHIWEELQKKFDIIEGYLQRDENRELINK